MWTIFLTAGVWCLLVAQVMGADLIVDKAMSLGLAVEAPGWKALSETQRDEYVESLEKLLTACRQPTKAAYEEVQKYAQSAKNTFDADPRLPLAYGLALQKLGKSDEALREFETSRRLPDDLYYPAWQAEVRTLIGQSKYEPATLSLAEMVRSLSQPRQVALSDTDRKTLVNWLGRVVGFLEGQTLKAPVTSKLKELESLIPAASRAEFDAGRTAVQEARDALDELIRLSLEHDREQAVLKANNLEAKADTNASLAADKEAQLQIQAQSIANLAQLELAEIDRRIAALETAGRSVRVRNPTGSVQAAQSQLRRDYLESQLPTRRSETPSQRFQREFRHQEAQQRVNFENTELGQLTASAALGQSVLMGQRISQELQNLRAAREQALRQRQSQISQLAKQERQAKQQEATAAAQKKVAEKLRTSERVPRSAHTSSLENQRRRLDTFVPWTFADEATRLLASFE